MLLRRESVYEIELHFKKSGTAAKLLIRHVLDQQTLMRDGTYDFKIIDIWSTRSDNKMISKEDFLQILQKNWKDLKTNVLGLSISRLVEGNL